MFTFRVVTLLSGDFFYEASTWSEARAKAIEDGHDVFKVTAFMPDGELVDDFLLRIGIGEF